MKKQKTFFDEELRLDKLEKKKDPLLKLKNQINWNIFKGILNRAFKSEPKGPGGRPRYNLIMMFKILILQRLYNLSDEQTEYMINDRLSFMRLLDLELSDDIPDQNTIWDFREALTKKDHADIQSAVDFNVDYIALSFARTADDVFKARELIKQAGGHQDVIAKIEALKE